MKKYLIPELEIEIIDGRDLFAVVSGDVEGGDHCTVPGGLGDDMFDPGFGSCPPDGPSCEGVSYKGQ